MGTVSYGFESMDEVAHQLHVAFGSGDKGNVSSSRDFGFPQLTGRSQLKKDRCR